MTRATSRSLPSHLGKWRLTPAMTSTLRGRTRVGLSIRASDVPALWGVAHPVDTVNDTIPSAIEAFELFIASQRS